MLDQIIKRLLFLIPILLGVVLVTFIIIHAIPGNPAISIRPVAFRPRLSTGLAVI